MTSSIYPLIIHSLHHWLNEKLTDTQTLKDHTQTSSIEIIKPVQHKHMKEVLDEIQNPKNGKSRSSIMMVYLQL